MERWPPLTVRTARVNRAVVSAGHVIGPPASKGNSPFTAQTFFSARETRDQQKHCRVSMIECSALLELFHIVERVNTVGFVHF